MTKPNLFIFQSKHFYNSSIMNEYDDIFKRFFILNKYFYDYNSKKQETNEVDSLLDTNINTFIAFENIIDYKILLQIFIKYQLSLVECVLYDKNMNKMISVVMPNSSMPNAQFDIVSYTQYVVLLKKYNPQIKLKVFDDIAEAWRYIGQFKYQYLVKKYFNIYNFTTCLVSKNENYLTYLNIFLLACDIHKIDYKVTINDILQNINLYADEYSLINAMKKIV